MRRRRRRRRFNVGRVLVINTPLCSHKRAEEEEEIQRRTIMIRASSRNLSMPSANPRATYLRIIQIRSLMRECSRFPQQTEAQDVLRFPVTLVAGAYTRPVVIST